MRRVDWAPLRPILQEAGPTADAVEILFSAYDWGLDRGVEHDYERSLAVEDAPREAVFSPTR